VREALEDDQAGAASLEQPQGLRSSMWTHQGAGQRITVTNRMQLVLFGMQNGTIGPYLAAMHWSAAPRRCHDNLDTANTTNVDSHAPRHH
jgi:hypothetical protein